MEIKSIKQLDNDYRVEITLNQKNNTLKKDEVVFFIHNKNNIIVKILEINENKIVAKKFSPCIYVWTTESYKSNNIYKVGLVNWQSVKTRLRQTDTTGVLEKIELVEIFKLDLNDYKITREIEQTIHKRIGKVRKDREAVKGDYKTKIRPTIEQVIKEFKAEKVIDNIMPLPRYYQQHAAEKAGKHFIKNDKGWIQWTCGSGKSFGGYWIYESIFKKNEIKNNIVIILVPSKQLVVQTHDDWKYIALSYGNNIRSIKLGGVKDATDDVGQIARWLQNASKETINLVVSTYQSSHKIADALRISQTTADFLINDEVHRLTGDDNKAWKQSLYDKVMPIRKRLSMTASPIEYTKKSTGFSGLENKKLFGKRFHQYSFLDAQFDGYVTPLEILGIEAKAGIINDIKKMIDSKIEIIMENMLDFNDIKLDDIKKEVNLKKGNPTFFIQLHNTLTALKEGTITHPIIYTNSIKRIRMFMACLKVLASTYEVNIDYMEVFTSEDKINERMDKLNNDFSNAKIGVVGNVYCLQEGISINEVDSIIMIDPRSSGPAIIQIIGRPVRLDENNPNKVAKIILPIFIKKYKNKTIIDRTYFEDTRDWMLNICAADADYSNMLISNLKPFTAKAKEGIEVREVLPASSLTNVSGRERKLDKKEKQSCMVDFDDIKNDLKLKTLISTQTNTEKKRNDGVGKQLRLDRQAFGYINSILVKIETYLSKYNDKSIEIYSKSILSEDIHISNFAQLVNINENKSKELLMKHGLKKLVNKTNELKDKNIKMVFSKI
jgi:superfamily II DNA or RNA helicase